MKIIRTGLLLAIGLGLSACASIDTATRNIPLEMPQMAPAAPVVAVADYNIKVSRSLRVSEANMYYPMGDIVWRGDPMGDRHAQIARIFQDSLTRVQTKNEDGALPVVVDIDLIRFHALTEKTRYTIGGVHSIDFNMTVRNPITGEVIVPTHEVKAEAARLRRVQGDGGGTAGPDSEGADHSAYRQCDRTGTVRAGVCTKRCDRIGGRSGNPAARLGLSQRNEQG